MEVKPANRLDDSFYTCIGIVPFNSLERSELTSSLTSILTFFSQYVRALPSLNSRNSNVWNPRTF